MLNIAWFNAVQPKQLINGLKDGVGGTRRMCLLTILKLKKYFIQIRDTLIHRTIKYSNRTKTGYHLQL